jgi:hypothetical protein
MSETPKEAARRFAEPLLLQGYQRVALHTYTDAQGEPIYYRIRLKHPETGEKWIRPMKLNGQGYEIGEPPAPASGKWLYALHGIASNPDAVVWIVEGEQKADALEKLGLVATTSGGATSANAADWRPLRGRSVRVWPDNDDPGKGYAGEVARILHELGCVVSCVDMDKLGLPAKGDVIDWLAAHPGAAVGDIEALPMLTPSRAEKNVTERIVVLDIDDLLTRDFPPMEPLLSPWLCRQHLSMVHAWRGVGKTHFALGVAYAVAGGGQFLKWKADKPRRVVYIDGEMAGAAIKARIVAIVESSPDEHEPPVGHFRIITPDAQSLPLPDLSTVEGQQALAPCIADAELIVVDNLSCLMRSGSENDAESWIPIDEWALELRRQGKTVLFVQHDGKGGQQRGTSKKEDVMDVVIQLEHTRDYDAERGAAFTVKFRKARHLKGTDAQDLEAALTHDEHGKQVWAWKVAELGMTERILALHAEAPDLTQTEIAEELGCNRSTVSRALKAVREQGAGGLQ